MKKQTLLSFIAIIVVLVFLIQCEKSEQEQPIIINITQPTIIVNNPSTYEFEEITIKVEEYAEAKGVRVNAEYFDWSIENSCGHVVENDFYDTAIIVWTPEESGHFDVIVEIGYGENDSVVASKHIYTKFNDSRLQYTGDYHFVKIMKCMGDSGIHIDTTYFNGFVMADPANTKNIIIKCSDGDFDSDDYFSTELIHTVGKIHPGFVIRPDGRFYYGGQFTGFNTLTMVATWNPLGGSCDMQMVGKMTRKW